MYSVDLAAFRLFAEMGGEVAYLVAAGPDTFGLFEYGKWTLHRIHNAEMLRQYDNIVYWGDFTTNPAYGLHDFTKQLIDFDGESSPQKAFDKWLSIFLLKGQDKGDRRIFSFGQNFQTMSSSTEQIDLRSLGPFYERFDAIMPRDTHSCTELGKYFPGIASGRLTLGTDCAFLLDAPDREKRPRTGNIGIFFGRSNIANITSLVGRISAAGYKMRHVIRWLATPLNKRDPYFKLTLGEFGLCDAVITDTYHFAVNAIREGATPILLSRQGAQALSTVSDFKKKVLMHDLGAADLLREFDGDELSDAMMESIIEQIAVIVDRPDPHPVHASARQQADRALSEFRRAFLG